MCLCALVRFAIDIVGTKMGFGSNRRKANQMERKMISDIVSRHHFFSVLSLLPSIGLLVVPPARTLHVPRPLIT